MFKTLLVAVDPRPRSLRSLEIAGRIADRWDSHVIGLYVKPPMYLPAGIEAGAETLAELQRKTQAELVAEARARFDAGVKAAGITRSEFRTADGDVAEAVALHARYADLVIVNQTDPEADVRTNFADAVLMWVGRPVLVVPYAGEFKTLGERVLVAWNASREAARAVTDALPFLQRAQQVVVLSIAGKRTADALGGTPGADVAVYLARHGVKTEVAPTVAADVDAGEEILSRAFDYGADLIVMGAYGHSRAREIVLGGATRTVLNSMTVPVLMSH
ncbi:MAG: universal stress protein [Burkholderiaceae bacterium]